MAQLQPVVMALPTLAVATVYCFWRLCNQAQQQRQRRLRERVAWMLWTMANELEPANEA